MEVASRHMPCPCRPKWGVLRSFTACTSTQLPGNTHVKSLVRPPHVAQAAGEPHSFQYKEGFYAGQAPLLSFAMSRMRSGEAGV
jgi:hypothetical protein